MIAAAQYLRMSTEHQQYSMQNQAATIQRYAETHDFKILQTYSDPGRSGLMLKRRPGLSKLLQDIAGGNQPYEVVLVYDVSRWGRFQDTDEAAHYEFICKSAGVPVIYCAETFSNDGSLPSLIMKSLKRIMAGEYSRELSLKTYEGQKRIVQLGYRSGGPAGYGLRRVMVSADGDRQQHLPRGARKALATDRVILVPGPTRRYTGFGKSSGWRLLARGPKQLPGLLIAQALHTLAHPGITLSFSKFSAIQSMQAATPGAGLAASWEPHASMSPSEVGFVNRVLSTRSWMSAHSMMRNESCRIARSSKPRNKYLTVYAACSMKRANCPKI
jgi:DNA invertase Pin-like site-specific DNA recombinase